MDPEREEKGVGRGKGKFNKAGAQAGQDARLEAIETFLEAEFPGTDFNPEPTPEEPPA